MTTTQAYEIALELEKAGKSGEISEAGVAFRDLENAVGKLIPALKEVVGS